MLRVKLLFLSMLALLAIGAVSASSASAAFEETTVKCEGPISTVCLEKTAGAGLFEAKGTEKLTGKLESPSKSTLSVPSLGLTIVCEVGKASGELEQPEPLVKAPLGMKVLITFEKCKVTGTHEKECKVVEPIKTKALDIEVLPTEPAHVEIAPETPKNFAEIEIGNQAGQTCPATIKGVNPVKGEILCLIPSPEVDATVHLIVCISTEGDELLEFGTNAATFEATFEAELESKKLFDIVLG